MAAGSSNNTGFLEHIIGGKTQGLPFDYQVSQADLLRRRKQVDAMLAAGLGSNNDPTIDAGTFKVANWSGPLQKIIQTMGGMYHDKGLREDEAAAAQDYNKRSGTAMMNYMTTRQGGMPEAIGQDTRALDTSGAEGAAPTAYMPSKPNPIKAIVEAMNSGLPGMQAIGAADLKNMQAGMIQPKDMLELAKSGHVDIPSIVSALQGGGVGALQGARSFQGFGDQGQTVQNGAPVGPPTPINTYTPAKVDPTINLPVQENPATGKVNALTGGNVTPGSHMQNKMADASVAQLTKGREEYLKGRDTLGNIAQTLTDLDGLDPSKFGTGAQLRNNIMKAGQVLGLPVGDGTSLMQNVHSGLGHLLIEKIRAFAPVTKEDIGKMEDILGSESNTKQALQKMLHIAMQSTDRNMQDHRKFVEGMSKQQGIPDAEAFRNQWAPDVKVETFRGRGAPADNANGELDLNKYRLGQ